MNKIRTEREQDMNIERKILPLKDLKTNTKNPRIIKDVQYKKLVQSLKDYPEMAEVREIVVNSDLVIVGGNMRYKAMQEAGWTEAPVKILPKDWTQDQINHFIIEDNVASGEWDWDILTNEWDLKLLDDWGITLPSTLGIEDDIADNNNQLGELSAVAVVVAFDDINALDKITSLYELESIDVTEDIKSRISGQRKVYVFRK